MNRITTAVLVIVAAVLLGAAVAMPDDPCVDIVYGTRIAGCR